MSEYQYYEFRAVDRRLTSAEMAELRGVSSRARITPDRFVNEYSYGDFRGDPLTFMEEYFDAFLYLANWGTHQLMLRFPAGVLDPDLARLYCPGDEASVHVRGDCLILEVRSEEEGGDWEEADGNLSSILPVRAEIASGDHRALYLIWLAWAQHDKEDDYYDEDFEEEQDEPRDAGEMREPPVPPGLGELTPAQQALADFLRVDVDLIAAAAERSASPAPAAWRAELRGWIGGLPEDEKTDLLARVALGEPGVAAELARRFRATQGGAPAAQTPRTMAALRDGVARHADERRRREADEAAREKARLAKEAAAALDRRLAELAVREEDAWGQADALIAEKKAYAYDRAVQLISDLHELALRAGRVHEAEARIAGLRERHATKRSFIGRLGTL